MNAVSIHVKAAELTTLAIQAQINGDTELLESLQAQVAQLDSQNNTNR